MFSPFSITTLHNVRVWKGLKDALKRAQIFKIFEKSRISMMRRIVKKKRKKERKKEMEYTVSIGLKISKIIICSNEMISGIRRQIILRVLRCLKAW